MLDGIVDRGAPIVANRTLAVFRRLCNWAVERGVIDASPCDKIKAPAAEESRDRVLTDDEIRLAWNAFDRVGWPFGPIAKLLLLTGARLNEIAGARWSEIDLDARTMDNRKGTFEKRRCAFEIPFSDAAIDVVKALPRIGDRKEVSCSRRPARRPCQASRARRTRSTRRWLRPAARGRGARPMDVPRPPPHGRKRYGRAWYPPTRRRGRAQPQERDEQGRRGGLQPLLLLDRKARRP